MIHRQETVRGFSLVEVVLAIGIFSFAVVAVMGLFGSSLGGVRDVVDRDAMIAAAEAAAEQAGMLTRSNLALIPPGHAVSDSGRPIFYGFLASNSATALSWSNVPPPPSSVASGRVYRVSLYRAFEAPGAEVGFASTNLPFPTRIVVDVIAPGQNVGDPAASWTFHRTFLPR